MTQKTNKIILLIAVILLIAFLYWSIKIYQYKKEDLIWKKYEELVSKQGNLIFEECLLQYLNSYKAGVYKGWEGICEVKDVKSEKLDIVLKTSNQIVADHYGIKVIFFDLSRMKSGLGLSATDRLVIKTTPYNPILYGYAYAIRESGLESQSGYSRNNLIPLGGVSVFRSSDYNLSHFYQNVMEEKSIIGFVGVFNKASSGDKLNFRFLRVATENYLFNAPVRELLINIQKNYQLPEVYEANFVFNIQ